MQDLERIIADLTGEAAEVDQLVADLPPEDWRRPTPAPAWSVAHQVAHLAFIFRIAGMAAADPTGFRAMTESLTEGFDAAVSAALGEYPTDSPSELLMRWRSERDAGIKALAAVPAGEVVPWLVNPLPPTVLGSAGMMELFAHGQDIADTLGITRVRDDRIGNLVSFAVRVRDFGYEARGMIPPEDPFRFEIVAPSGQLWTFGPEDAEQRITGAAEDFCLLVTRRRNRADLDVRAEGTYADGWLDIAQAYRGPAGQGREPGQFR